MNFLEQTFPLQKSAQNSLCVERKHTRDFIHYATIRCLKLVKITLNLIYFIYYIKTMENFAHEHTSVVNC